MPSRMVLVARCSVCDGVTLPPDTIRYDCPDCKGKDTRGHIDVREAPPPRTALNAPFMIDRFYENTRATDGTDIGSRAKHREYMRRNGLTTADDFKGVWAEGAKERARIVSGEADRRERREQIGWAKYEIDKRGRRR
jgi:hypothetical protein